MEVVDGVEVEVEVEEEVILLEEWAWMIFQKKM